MELIQIRPGRPSPSAGWRPSVFLDGAFRPFFLLAGLYACAPLIAWLVLFGRGTSFVGRWPAMSWHAHEMIFGFATSAMAGFLLTAVPKWTKTKPISRRLLGVLVASWALGRVAMWTVPWLPPWLAAALDLVLFPILAVAAGGAILKTRNRRNLAFPALLTGLFVANLLTHLDPGGRYGRLGQNGGVAIFLIAIVIIGGRIVPLFTWSALERAGLEVQRRKRGWLRVVTLVTSVAALIADFGLDLGPVAGALAILAGVALLGAAAGWDGHRTLKDPLVWVLHLGWAWLGLAFVLRGLALTTAWVPLGSGLHAFTAGAMGTMIVAMMSRASLGHTGRPLEANGVTTAAYVLVALGALVRVFGPIVAPAHRVETVIAGGVIWTLGFVLYVAVFLPILGKPRIDGRPG